MHTPHRSYIQLWFVRSLPGQNTEFSERGYWSVSYEELLYHFGAEVSNTNELGKELEKETYRSITNASLDTAEVRMENPRSIPNKQL